jgi:hypothetical protein
MASGKDDNKETSTQGALDEEIPAQHIVSLPRINEDRPSQPSDDTDDRPTSRILACDKDARTDGREQQRIDHAGMIRDDSARDGCESRAAHSQTEERPRKSTPAMKPGGPSVGET